MFWSEMADYTVFSVFLGAAQFHHHNQPLLVAPQRPLHFRVDNLVPQAPRWSHLWFAPLSIT